MKKRLLLSLLALLAASLLLTGCSGLFGPDFKAGEIDGTYVMTISYPATDIAEAYTVDYAKLVISGTTGSVSRVSDFYLASCEQWATLRKLNQDPGVFPTTVWNEPEKFIESIDYENYENDWNMRIAFAPSGTYFATASKDKKTITIYISSEEQNSYTSWVFTKR